MYTTGGKTKKARVPRKESWAMAFGYIATTQTLVEGQSVKLNSDGTVQAAVAADFPIGIVDVGGKNVYAETGRVTILTNFKAEIFGVSSGATTTGGFVVDDGVNASGDIKFKTAATGNWVTGVVIKGSADTVECVIGSLRTPFKL